MSNDFIKKADGYCRKRPRHITHWLQGRRISESVQDEYKIGFNGQALTIPIIRADGSGFFKFRADPFDKKRKNRYWSEQGANAELYPRAVLDKGGEQVFIVEGELKALTLISLGYPALAGTAGAGTFREQWVTEIKSKFKNVVLLFDEDSAGKEGAKICLLKLQA